MRGEKGFAELAAFMLFLLTSHFSLLTLFLSPVSPTAHSPMTPPELWNATNPTSIAMPTTPSTIPVSV